MSEYALNASKSIFLFRLSPPENISFDTYYFCNQANITHNGNTYREIPYLEIAGLSSSASGVLATPTLTIGDNGLVSLWVSLYNNLKGFEVNIKRIKTANLANSNPLYQTPGDTFVISQKVNHIPGKFIAFKLQHRATMQSQIPGRVINSTCTWKRYRGAGCNYQGQAMFTQENQPTSNPELDICALTLDACSIRGNTENYSGVPTIDDF